jgi:hypothetical protein
VWGCSKRAELQLGVGRMCAHMMLTWKPSVVACQPALRVLYQVRVVGAWPMPRTFTESMSLMGVELIGVLLAETHQHVLFVSLLRLHRGNKCYNARCIGLL